MHAISTIKARLGGTGRWEIFSCHYVLLPSDVNCGSVYQHSKAMDLNQNRKNCDRIL